MIEDVALARLVAKSSHRVADFVQSNKVNLPASASTFSSINRLRISFAADQRQLADPQFRYCEHDNWIG
jgi:hypothetical protein